MPKAKSKIAMYADEAMLEQKQRAGLVRFTELSLKALVPDSRFQARVKIDLDHVAILERVLIEGMSLTPAVVWELPDGRQFLVDGFHRREAYLRFGAEGFPARVVQGTEQEAIEYAAAANQRASLPRNREDVRKAIKLLFANGWFDRGDNWIADHVGSSPGLVAKLRTEYAIENAIALPKEIMAVNGKMMRRAKPGTPSKRCKDGSYFIQSCGKVFGSVGSHDRHMATVRQIAGLLARSNALADFLSRRGVILKPQTEIHLPIYSACGWAFATLADLNANASFATAFANAIGRAVIAGEYFKTANRAVLIADPFDSQAVLKEIAGRLGVEVIALPEFTARLTGLSIEQCTPAPRRSRAEAEMAQAN